MNNTGKQYVIGLASYPYQNPDTVFSYISKDITSPQILDLFNTPVEIVPTPGTGKALSVTKVIITLNYVTTTYTATGNLNITEGANNISQFGNSILPATSSKTIQNLSSSVVLTANNPLMLKITGSNPTLGNGTLRIQVWYNEVVI